MYKVMERLKSSGSIFYWLQFLVVAMGIVYSFTFSTFHVHQGGFSAKVLNFKMPFINGLFFYMMLSIGIVFSIINQILNKQYHQPKIFDGLLITCILYNAISLFWVKDVGLGLAALTTIISFYVFYFLANDFFQRKGEPSLRYLYYLLCALIVVFVFHFFISNADVLLKFINTDHSYQKIITQSKSWVGGKNQTACFLGLLLPLIVLLNQNKWLTNLLLSIISIHILIMGSRNAYIALIAFFGIFLLFNKIKLKQLAKVSFLLLVVLLIFGTFVGFEVFINQLKNNTWGSRFIFWQQTLQMGIDHWLLGIGAGQWDIYRLQYDVWHIYKHPHNDFIRSFAELGITGFLLFYSVIGIILFEILKNFKRHKKLATAAIAAVCVYLSLSFFDELKMKDNYNILLALIFALVNYKLPSLKLPKASAKLTNLGFRSFLFIGALYLVIYPLKLQSEMQHFKKYRSFAKQKETELAVDELQKINKTLVSSIDRNPINVLIANYYFNTRNMDSALVYYALVNETNPYYKKQIIGNIDFLSIKNENKAWKQLAKLYLLNPCNTVIEDCSFDMPPTKRNKYYRNIIKQQEARCIKQSHYE